MTTTTPMTPTTPTSPAGSAGGQVASQIAYLARALKTPTIARVWDELAQLARDGEYELVMVTNQDGLGTGFLVPDAAGMAEAIGCVGALDREGIRRVARERFSDARMSGEYLALYRRLAA